MDFNTVRLHLHDFRSHCKENISKLQHNELEIITCIKNQIYSTEKINKANYLISHKRGFGSFVCAENHKFIYRYGDFHNDFIELD